MSPFLVSRRASDYVSEGFDSTKEKGGFPIVRLEDGWKHASSRFDASRSALASTVATAPYSWMEGGYGSPRQREGLPLGTSL